LSLLAAGVRIAAPLVAAWLWERVLVSARRHAAARSAAQIRADRRLLAFARSAQTLRRQLKSQAASERQIRRARRRFDHHHVALLQRIPATDPKLRDAIGEWLTELHCADTLYLDWTPPGVQNLSETLEKVATSPDTRTHPADISTRVAGAVSDVSVGVSDSLATSPSAAVPVSDSRSSTDRPNGQVSDTASTLAASARQISDAVPNAASDTPSQSLNLSGTIQALTAQCKPATETTTITPALSGSGPDSVADSPGAVADTSDTYPPSFGDVSATLGSDRNPLSAAVDIVRTHGPLSGSDMAKQMGRCGHPMSERTGLRWRDRAEEHRQQHQNLAPAP
jgi:hypothetical protein